MRTIVLTGGGTAGHVLPNIALLHYIKKHFDKIYYIGSVNGIEKQIALENGLEYYGITTVKLKRKFSLENLLIPFKLLKGISQAKKLLKALKPNVIFSKGGFVALPVMKAGCKLGIKIVAHESDMTMGLANKLTANKCGIICSTFPLDKKLYPNSVHTGAIIRKSIYDGDRSKIHLRQNGKPNLLIMGGSSGAVAINNLVWNVIDDLLKSYNVLHITGRGKSSPNIKKDNYLQTEYQQSPENAFEWADIVVSRAGSGVVSEMLALKKPALYIPLPKDESRGDQIQNAIYLNNLGLCEILYQEDLTNEVFLQKLNQVYEKKQQILENLKTQDWIDGTSKVVSYLLQN